MIGLSLLSTSIMTLTKNKHITQEYGQEDDSESGSASAAQSHTDDSDADAEESVIRLLLKPCSLYVLTGEARYDYAHAIVGAKDGPQMWDCEDGAAEEIIRDRRISLILRDEKQPDSL